MTLSCIRGHVGDAFGRANVLTTVLLLLAVVPLAHASPPDPTWTAGIYDNADLDEAVVAVTNADALIERGSLSDKTIFVVRDGAPTLDVPANALSRSLQGIAVFAPRLPRSPSHKTARPNTARSACGTMRRAMQCM